MNTVEELTQRIYQTAKDALVQVQELQAAAIRDAEELLREKSEHLDTLKTLDALRQRCEELQKQSAGFEEGSGHWYQSYLKERERCAKLEEALPWTEAAPSVPGFYFWMSSADAPAWAVKVREVECHTSKYYDGPTVDEWKQDSGTFWTLDVADVGGVWAGPIPIPSSPRVGG